MRTKFFRGNTSVKAGVLVRRWRRLRLAMTALLLWPVALSAQNGITISGLVVESGTVTFDVSWNKNAMPVAVWSDSVWVFVDYNKGGVMTRLLLAPGATLTTHTAPETGRVIQYDDNNKGVWVVGNARTEGSFSATVQLLTVTADVAGACAYASNYPPVGEYISLTHLSFTGTPPFDIVLKNEENDKIYRTSGADFDISGGYTLASFTDATGAPGIIRCIPPATYTLRASALDFCAGSEGVRFALSGTENGRQYQLFRDNSEVGTVLDGDGSAATFSDSFNVAGTYTAKSVPTTELCEGTMDGVHLITENPLPTIAHSGGDASQTINTGTAISPITYTASNATTIALARGSFPAGITGSPSGTNFTISGTPSAGGTFSYAVQASHTNGCTSSLSSGTITVNVTIPPYAATTQTWTYGTLTWSDRIAAAPPHCAKVTSLSTASTPPAEYVKLDYFYYNWVCVAANPAWFCPSPWRFPVKSDTDYLKTFVGTIPPDDWYPRSGQFYNTSHTNQGNEYWWLNECDTNRAWGVEFGSQGYKVECRATYCAVTVHCVR